MEAAAMVFFGVLHDIAEQPLNGQIFRHVEDLQPVEQERDVLLRRHGR